MTDSDPVRLLEMLRAANRKATSSLWRTLVLEFQRSLPGRSRDIV